MKKVRYEYTYIDEDYCQQTLTLREDVAEKLYQALKADFQYAGADW